MEEAVAQPRRTGAEAAQGGPDAARAGHSYVVLDGTLIPIDRAADRPFYSGKHKRHGMNLQVIAGPRGGIRWVSGALPGSVHDKKAERMRGVLAELQAAGLVTPRRQGLPGEHVREDPVQGEEQAGSPETGQQGARQLAGAR